MFGFLQLALLPFLLPSLASSAQIPNRKVSQTFKATQITLSTPLNAATVINNLDVAINRKTFNNYDFPVLAAATVAANNKSAFEALVASKIGPYQFMMFNQISYDGFMPWYNKPLGHATPIMRRYTIGNPLIASTMIKWAPQAGFHVPVDVIVISDYGLNGTAPKGGDTTRIIWDLPSSLIAIDGKGKVGSNTRNLWDATQYLDEKLEVLLRAVSGN